MSNRKRYVVITQQIEGNTRSGFDAYFYSDLKLFDDGDQAMRYGLAQRGSDDFNIGTVLDGRLVAFGCDDWNFGDPGHAEDEPHGGYDLAEIERQTYMRERWSR